jgi:predicted SAM-dependent methyltransferase
MNETEKTNKLRGSKFLEQYMSGKLIDIGAGKDLVCEWAERFDIEDGDANFITSYRKKASYDTVHSSHCLEHMFDPKSALKEWWELVKPNGYMIIVVPDENLYEQGIWPSNFNSDHKNTFRLNESTSWSPVSHNIHKLFESLPNLEVISSERQDAFYDYNLQFNPSVTIGTKPFWFKLITKILVKLNPIKRQKLKKMIDQYAFKHFQVPMDQTKYEAVAQIQVIAKKVM